MVVEVSTPNGFIQGFGPTERPGRVSANCDMIRDRSSSIAQNVQQASATASPKTKDKVNPRSKPIKRYYIDELGFYRYLDYEQKQYVCSNVSMVNSYGRKGSLNRDTVYGTATIALDESSWPLTVSGTSGHRSNKISVGSGVEAGQEVSFKTVRNDLGISHFDKTENYESWKKSWDEFMRVKLQSQQPVTLNRELKSRVRSGIPHDYRCKVWSAIIRMRTRTIRATFGDDIYDVIISDYVSKISIPDYSTETQHDSNNNTSEATTTAVDWASATDENNSPALPRTKASASLSSTLSSASSSSTTTANNGSSYISSMTTTLVDSIEAGGGGSGGKEDEGPRLSQRMIAQEPQIDKCFKQIELDLLRTLPNNRHFENPNSIGIKRVRRVLRAYACFNQEVAYCQGMNRLAAMALLVLPEEEAFWCLVAIIQCIMPRDYYLKPWLAQVDCCVLGDLLEKKLPRLHKHLVANDIQLTLFSWFFTIFVDGFRPELMLRIWDCFLLEGDKVLFRFALAILHLTQDELLKMSDFSTMSSHLSRLVSTRALDVEQLFETFNTMNPLSTGSLQARREFHKRRMRAMLEE